MTFELRGVIKAASTLSLVLLTACGGGGSNPPQPPPPPPPPPPPGTTYTVGGSVSGLVGSGLSLALNGGGNLTVAANGAFTFPTGLATGASYTVTVVTHPTGPSQVCSVSSGSGAIATSNVTAVAVTCAFAGRFAYVANNGLNNIESVSAYSINRTTGLLTPLTGSPYSAGHTPISLAVRPDGKFLYVVNPVGMPMNGAISVFSINDTTGVLAQIAGSPFAVSTGLYQIAIDPSGKFAFTANFTSPSVSAFTLDTNSGVPSPVAGGPFACVGTPVSVAVDPTGKFVYVATVGGGPNNSGVICAYTINANTGALTQVAGSPFTIGSGQLRTVTVDPSGKFVFGAHSAGVVAFALNPASGALTAVSGSPFAAGGNLQAVAVDPAGKFLYAGNNSLGASNSVIFGFSINATTGSLTPIAGSPFPSSDTPYFIAIDPSGDLAYVANVDSNVITVYAVNKVTGALTVTGSPIPNGADTNPAAIAILK